MKDIVIIGAGRLGKALGRALSEAGYRVKAAADRSPAARRGIGRLIPGCRSFADNAQAGRLGRALFLCVPDSAIAPVAAELAETDIDWRGRVVAHCSGLLDSRILAPLRGRGALTASCHPVKSFPGKLVPSRALAGVSVGLEGDRKAVAWLRPVFRRLGATPLVLRTERKPLYHTACSLASNDLVALLDMAQELLLAAGFSRDTALGMLLPLAQGTLHNVKKLGTAASLTGPMVRGDEAIVARHLSVLRQFPRIREAYKKLGLQALDLAEKSGGPPQKIRALRRLLGGR